MHRLAALLTALIAFIPFCATASADEDCIQLAYQRPHPPAVLADEARDLFNDVNAARARHHLRPLEEDPTLTAFAYDVAQDMAERHYFGHTDPAGQTFQDRIKNAHLDYRYAAENLAYDQDERSANAAFLHSRGHFENIVDPTTNRLGVAVIAAGDGEVFYVEEFSD
jgi:uncharacterized protein YkwD